MIHEIMILPLGKTEYQNDATPYLKFEESFCHRLRYLKLVFGLTPDCTKRRGSAPITLKTRLFNLSDHQSLGAVNA